MVDRKKVALMTKAARESKRNRKLAAPAVGFFMYDYVLLQVIKGVFAVTLLYVAVAACYLLYTMEQWIARSTLYDLIHIAQRLGIIYLLVLAVSVIFLGLIYSLRYIQARSLVEEEERLYKMLDRYYDRID